jgi:hypothetical protein
MINFTDNTISKIEKELEKLLLDVFNVVYNPKFPNQDKTTFSWFQIIFAIGPGKNNEMKEQSLAYIPALFKIFVKYKVYKFSDIVSIRIRRRTKD